MSSMAYALATRGPAIRHRICGQQHEAIREDLSFGGPSDTPGRFSGRGCLLRMGTLVCVVRSREPLDGAPPARGAGVSVGTASEAMAGRSGVRDAPHPVFIWHAERAEGEEG